MKLAIEIAALLVFSSVSGAAFAGKDGWER
jgi:hypothetical protein